MTATRRQVLIGGAIGVAFGTLLVAAPQVPGFLGRPDAPVFTSPRRIRRALAALPESAGSDHIHVLAVERTGVIATVLTDGDTQLADAYWMEREFWSASWRDWSKRERSDIESPTWATPDQLPVDSLPRAARLEDEDDIRSLTLRADDAGRWSLTMSRMSTSDDVGVRLDGSAFVPELALDTGNGAAAAVAEMTAAYGTEVVAVGAFNDFVHVDLGVAGFVETIRVVRRATLDVEANISSFDPPDPALVFPAASVDVSAALRWRDGIAERAGVDGQVDDWLYSRPGPGEEPMLSYGLSGGGQQRIWVGADGEVVRVG